MPLRFYWLAVPVLSTLYQLFIKLGAAQLKDEGTLTWFWHALSSHWILAAIVVEIVAFFIWMNVLAELELSRAFPLTGISYVLVVAAGWFFFGERVVALQMIGSGLILTGVWLIAGASFETNEHHDELDPRQDELRTGTGKDK
ncbi:SMR family transporter [Rhizobium sp. P44RR-XXIV]|uniref:SMR family transporter n=1 Tax=Rhizobium sp. P44RR-XXIV TaxID=1921145 RepID=UPI0009840B26|nr:SMR family transporter [Rhizobium sp. P44RR-XXIV]TIX93139.1 transporter [Rhizobium sp. P44RR-XXIV]